MDIYRNSHIDNFFSAADWLNKRGYATVRVGSTACSNTALGNHHIIDFYPITADQKCYAEAYQEVSLPVARYLADHVLTLPIYEGLEEENIERIVGMIVQAGM